DRLQWPAHNVVAALMLLHELDVAGQYDPITVPLDLGDETPARGRVGVIRAHTQRVAEVAKCFEGYALRRPTFELIRAVGHQEVPALSVEAFQRGPTFASIVGADQRCQRVGAVSLALERVEETGKPLLHGVGAHEVQPIDAAALGLGSRKRGPAALDR